MVAGKGESGAKPQALIAMRKGEAGCVVLGSTDDNCSVCGAVVTVSPATRRSVPEGLPIVCLNCLFEKQGGSLLEAHVTDDQKRELKAYGIDLFGDQEEGD